MKGKKKKSKPKIMEVEFIFDDSVRFFEFNTFRLFFDGK